MQGLARSGSKILHTGKGGGDPGEVEVSRGLFINTANTRGVNSIDSNP
jgi:hypothetical protein